MFKLDTLEQLNIDLLQVDFINEERKQKYLLDINAAIAFKKQPWDLSFDYVWGRKKLSEAIPHQPTLSLVRFRCSNMKLTREFVFV